MNIDQFWMFLAVIALGSLVIVAVAEFIAYFRGGRDA